MVKDLERRLGRMERHTADAHQRVEVWLTDTDGISRNETTGAVLAAEELRALPAEPNLIRIEVKFVEARIGRPA